MAVKRWLACFTAYSRRDKSKRCSLIKKIPNSTLAGEFGEREMRVGTNVDNQAFKLTVVVCLLLVPVMHLPHSVDPGFIPSPFYVFLHTSL